MADMIRDMYYKMVSYLSTEKGQTLVEYALILVLIALIVILMLKGVGTNVNTVYSRINSGLVAP